MYVEFRSQITGLWKELPSNERALENTETDLLPFS